MRMRVRMGRSTEDQFTRDVRAGKHGLAVWAVFTLVDVLSLVAWTVLGIAMVGKLIELGVVLGEKMSP